MNAFTQLQASVFPLLFLDGPRQQISQNLAKFCWAETVVPDSTSCVDHFMCLVLGWNLQAQHKMDFTKSIWISI